MEIRVLLEPQTPTEQLAFPEGPRYIMMCYNLHSAAADPGPKADKEFLQGCMEKMDHIADDETIYQWIEYIRNAGETDISLWRLGGNRSLG